MNFRKLILVLCLAILSLQAFADVFSIKGKVLSATDQSPIEYATVIIESTTQWAVCDEKGEFTISNIHGGNVKISISSLGYVTDVKDIILSKDITNYKVLLKEDNLALDGAMVTAKENSSSTTTARTIDKTALDHVQVMNVSDISSLLPGGATVNPTLLGNHYFSVRSGQNTGEDGNILFGTAVEVDGVRLSNNSSFGGADATSTSLKGANTNSIASSNVESIEVISGVASVEYGDLSTGVVKVNTKKGKTPLTITMSTTPNNKQLSVSKGFGLKTAKGRSAGVVNASAEITRSIGEPMSPFNSFLRRQVNLGWSHTLTKGIFTTAPLKLGVGFTGNLGGQNTLSDPDTYKDSYTKSLDNIVRGNFKAEWLVNKPWLTNIEFTAAVSYSDKSVEQKSYYSAVTSGSAIHGTTLGYHITQPYGTEDDQYIIQLPPSSSWSNVMNVDDRPLYAKATLKANWARNFGKVSEKIKVGGDFSTDKNLGIGQYTDDLATAPTFREYRYCDVPAMNNAAAYIENTLTVPVGKGRINLVAGVRNDNTIIRGSEYGVKSSVSPRVSAKYVVLDEKGRTRDLVRSLSFRAGWGKSTKLPSFAILFPAPSYYDVEVFRSNTTADNYTTSVFFTHPKKTAFNPDLLTQSTTQTEVGVDFNIAGVKVGLAGYYTESANSYRIFTHYTPFSYTYTNGSALQACPISSDDRVYSVDQSGVVTVSDKNGVNAPFVVPGVTRTQYMPDYMAGNDLNPVRRYGLEWTLEFPKIKAINTTVKMDGNFSGYKSVRSNLIEDSFPSQAGADGNFFKYVAYYYGTDQQSNGSLQRSVRQNITFITHIPQVRMIVSMKIEAGLYTFSQALTETADGGRRSWALDDRSKILETSNAEIYGREGYVTLYPLYYSSMDEPGVKKDFLEALKWAKDNDSKMYSDLSRLVVTTNFNYIFKTDRISPYLNANFSITKEIGDMASISFYANNFFNNCGQVFSQKTGNWESVSNRIPTFYYGLTLRLKF